MKKVSMALLVVFLVVIFVGCNKKTETENVEQPTAKQPTTSTAEQPAADLSKFAQCLTEKGAKMYGTEWCSHCKSQKKRFGEYFEFVDFTDCDQEKDVCEEAGISGYPTWVINGEKYSGNQPLSKLSEITGCSLPL